MGKRKPTLLDCKHPNSRKTVALCRQLKRQSNRQKSKQTAQVKYTLLADKLQWFRERLDDEQEVCTPQEVEKWIQEYLGRFGAELEQIQLKQAIGVRRKANRPHAAREDIIRMQQERELSEFNAGGLELPDLLDPQCVQILREWNGEINYLPKIKLRHFNSNFFLNNN